MKRCVIPALLILASLGASTLRAQSRTYPPISHYLMPRETEVALARSAAPPAVSDRATVKVLTATGFEVAEPGDNGAVCMVMRGFSAPTFTPAPFRDLVYDPTIHAPICFMPAAARAVMPYYELRTTLAIAGNTPEQIAVAVQTADKKGDLPKREGVSFAYMWSAHQHLGSGVDAWHPHMMVFAPNYDNTMVGGHAFGSPLPQVTDDAGTPFAVVVIPVDDALAVKPLPKETRR
ncbi:MAG: hypothetical protein ABI211_11345 [Vicinamibacterales bacterium]